MSAAGPILILEDDLDDQEILEVIFKSLNVKNIRQYFGSSDEFLEYLLQTPEKPLLIFSDINMVKANGIELKKIIESNPFLKGKTIPYVFLTTSANPPDVRQAYDLHSQGFFVKSADVSNMTKVIDHILFYWKMSLHPNNI